MSDNGVAQKSVMQRVLDVVEKAGNLVPHPVLIFLTLILIVIALSHVMALTGVSVTFDAIVPEASAPSGVADSSDSIVEDPQIYDTGTTVNYETLDEKNYEIKEQTVAARSLVSLDGIRFMYVSLIPNFMGFTAVGLMIAAMIGAGIAEASGLVNAVIRKLVIISPKWALIYILSLVGILSSVAADAGYLVLIPLAGTAFLSVGRHPIAGLALGFAAVAGAFTVNMLIKPLDAVLVEFTNDAIALVDPSQSIGLASNIWFSIVSVVMLTVLLALITERLIEPRMGLYDPALAGDDPPIVEQGALSADESRGLTFAAISLVATLGIFALLTLPEWAPLRDPDTGVLIGNSPFMNGLIALIMILFLVTGAAYGYGARTITSLTGIIQAIEKAMSGMGGLILLFMVLSQFIAYFNYSNMGTILALEVGRRLDGCEFPRLAFADWLHCGRCLDRLVDHRRDR